MYVGLYVPILYPHMPAQAAETNHHLGLIFISQSEAAEYHEIRVYLMVKHAGIDAIRGPSGVCTCTYWSVTASVSKP